jgi:hypothetical protein
VFDAYCPACGKVGLYGFSRLRGLENSTLGIELTIECYCGEILTVLTGWGPALSASGRGAPRR